MQLINDLAAKGDAMLVRPSKTIHVSRFKGDPIKLKKLYNLGYSDMESRRDELMKFLGRA